VIICCPGEAPCPEHATRRAARRLVPGTVVGHANPQLADWEGTVVAMTGRGCFAGQHARRLGTITDVRVQWHAGSADGDGRTPLAGCAGWIEATALTLKGDCEWCGRPGWYVFAGSSWGRSEGWYHDGRGCTS
jgi:hypothetical protein